MNSRAPVPIPPASRIRRRAAFVIVFVTLSITAWFFLRMWSNVDVLSSRTLPGVGYASELIDRAAAVEIARLGNSADAADVENASHIFLDTLSLYESTAVVEQDKHNIRRVRQAHAAYMEHADAESWQQLRAEVKGLHDFRHQRAMMFANDSQDRFSSALVVNFCGVIVFAVLSLTISIGLASRQDFEPRPDDF